MIGWWLAFDSAEGVVDRGRMDGFHCGLGHRWCAGQSASAPIGALALRRSRTAAALPLGNRRKPPSGGKPWTALCVRWQSRSSMSRELASLVRVLSSGHGRQNYDGSDASGGPVSLSSPSSLAGALPNDGISTTALRVGRPHRDDW